MYFLPGVGEEATRATVAALQAEWFHFDVVALDAEDLDRFTCPEQEHEWPVVQISSGRDSNSVVFDRWSGHQPKKIIEWSQKMATIEEEEIESVATLMLTAVVSNNRESHPAANQLRASEAHVPVVFPPSPLPGAFNGHAAIFIIT